MAERGQRVRKCTGHFSFPPELAFFLEESGRPLWPGREALPALCLAGLL
jgi:hypothetical protein